jgi:hypothetical protein
MLDFFSDMIMLENHEIPLQKVYKQIITATALSAHISICHIKAIYVDQLVELYQQST